MGLFRNNYRFISFYTGNGPAVCFMEGGEIFTQGGVTLLSAWRVNSFSSVLYVCQLYKVYGLIFLPSIANADPVIKYDEALH